jgi:hypothetical protein
MSSKNGNGERFIFNKAQVMLSNPCNFSGEILRVNIKGYKEQKKTSETFYMGQALAWLCYWE